MTRLENGRKAAANSTLAIGGASSPVDSFVVAKVQFSEQTIVLKSPPIANLQTVTSNAMTTVQPSTYSAKNGQTKCQRFVKLKELQCQRTSRPKLQHI